MAEQLSSRTRFFAWCNVAVGAIFAVAGAFFLVAGEQPFNAFAVMVLGLVWLADGVLRLRGPFEARGKALRQVVLAAAYLLWLASMLWTHWQAPAVTSTLLVGIGVMGLTMGMLYLALLLSGALSARKQ